jgi:hypothetical protein
MTDQAVTGVTIQKAERDLIESGPSRVDLGQDVDAVPVVFDHLFDAANLTFDPPETSC